MSELNTTSASFKDRANGLGLYWYSQMVRKTCRFQYNDLDRLLTAFESERPLILTGWHGITMMAVPLVKNHHKEISNFTVLMPDDWRGIALQIWADKMGSATYRMNLTGGDNTMGMARQVLKLTRRMIGGKSLFINPDGPDGPAQVIKPGITFIAKKSNAIVLPIGAYCRHGYRAPRWDRYTMPYAYSRIAFHIGEPIESFPDDDAEANKLLTNRLNHVTLQAEADYYEQK